MLRPIVRFFAIAVAVVTPVLVGCSESESSTSSTSKFTCKINGTCYVCPSSDAEAACFEKGGAAAGCSLSSDDACD